MTSNELSKIVAGSEESSSRVKLIARLSETRKRDSPVLFGILGF
jgi:hypothetical protein